MHQGGKASAQAGESKPDSGASRGEPTPFTGTRNRLRRSAGWLSAYWPCVAATLALLLLAYGTCWQRGPYQDDYQLEDLAKDAVTGESWPIWSQHRIPTYPVRTLNWVVVGFYASLLPQHEWLARVLAAANVVANSMLLGWLVFRVLGSRLAALVAGWLFLFPFCAQEALLWASAHGYLAATMLVLGALHGFLTWLFAPRGRWLVLAAGVLACAVSLLLVEQPIVMLALLPPLAICQAIVRRPGGYWRLARRCAVLSIGLAGGLSLMTWRIYFSNRDVFQIVNRGGFTKSSEETYDKCREFVEAFEKMTTGKPGRQYTFEALLGGVQTQFSRPFPGLLLVLAAAAVTGLCLQWRRWRDQRATPVEVGAILAIAAAGSFFLVLWIPGVLIRFQKVEWRMLDVPAGMLALASATAVWLLVKVLARFRPAARPEIAVLAVLGAVTWCSATCVLGYAKAFARRSQLDREELAATQRVLTLMQLPPRTWLICFDNVEQPVPPEASLPYLTAGVLETSWSAESALAGVLGRRDFRIVANYRGLGTVFSPGWEPFEPEGHVLWVNDAQINAAEAVMITFRDGQSYVVTELTLRAYPEATGSATRVYKFPLAEELARRGAPHLRASVIAGETQFSLCVE